MGQAAGQVEVQVIITVQERAVLVTRLQLLRLKVTTAAQAMNLEVVEVAVVLAALAGLVVQPLVVLVVLDLPHQYLGLL
jgi:hypothetical protein